jgi:hypothetical protein
MLILGCILGIICLSSCRSTKSNCGLAEKSTTTQTILQQAEFI